MKNIEDKIRMDEADVTAYIKKRQTDDWYKNYAMPENPCERIRHFIVQTGFWNRMAKLQASNEYADCTSLDLSEISIHVCQKPRWEKCKLNASSNSKKSYEISLSYEWAAMIVFRAEDPRVMNALKITLGHEIGGHNQTRSTMISLVQKSWQDPAKMP